MSEQETHAMVLKGTHVSGAEEWFCPQCGRRFIMQWPPHYTRIILEAGDEYACHTASKGGLLLGPVQVMDESNPEINADPHISEDNLGIWLDHLNDLDFGEDDLPPQPNQ